MMTQRIQELLISLKTKVDSSQLTAAFDTAFGDELISRCKSAIIYRKNAPKIRGEFFE